MSLLLQALQRAAKSREVTGQEPEAGGAPRLELEPQPGAPSNAADRPLAASLDLEDVAPAPPRRTAPLPGATQPPYLAQDYGGPTLLDYVRERPLVAFGAFALLFAVSYGVYLYLQIFHPDWLRGDFGQSTTVIASTPPPLQAPPPSASAPYSLPPAPTYPATGATSSATASTTLAQSNVTTSIPLPGMAPPPGTSSVPGAPPSPGASPQQNAELASLMNLPAPQSATPAAAPAQSRLSTLGKALSENQAVSTPEPARSAPPASRASNAIAPQPPARLAPAAPAQSAPSAQPSPRPRTPTPPRTNLAAAKPLAPGQPQSGTNVIELKDQVVINAAPAQQIESATVADAYRAWRGGKLEQAREIYRDVLANDPKNVDALLGLAGIAQQQGSTQEALSYFGRALELDPRNSSAQAGIIAMTGQSDPSASEARLKQLIAREPSAFLHFTLGNLYARQNQWAQAQQSYFQAVSMNADNSDYTYNLAVSLEHIGQDKLAVTYYRKAVDLSLKQGGRASFNQEQVIDRIAKLSLRTR